MAKIVGFMVVGPGEADRWLEQVLDQRKEMVDDMIIVGNNTDSKTEKLIKKYGYWFYRDDREWGIFQPNIKTKLLQRVAKLRPDWIIATDADELFGKAFTRKEADKLMTLGHIGYYFYIVNLWNDEQHMRKFLNFWNVRFYRFAPELNLQFLNRPLHCGLAPHVIMKYAKECPFILKHYGLMKEEDRKKKIERYEKYDPKAIHKDKTYYDALSDTTVGSPFNEKELQESLNKEIYGI